MQTKINLLGQNNEKFFFVVVKAIYSTSKGTVNSKRIF